MSRWIEVQFCTFRVLLLGWDAFISRHDIQIYYIDL